MTDPSTERLKVRILRKMFRAVGLKFPGYKKLGKDWYLKHAWTEQQEREFRRWLEATLRHEFGWTIKMAQREASWFLLDYGWKSEQPVPVRGLGRK